MHQDKSGQLRLRIPKDLHKDLALSADRQGVSLNTYMIYLLSKGGKNERDTKVNKKVKKKS